MHRGPCLMSPCDINTYKVPDLEAIALCLDNEEAIGDIEAIATFAADLRIVIGLLHQGKRIPEGFVFFVPDFWHITFGRAKCMPSEEGKILWEASGVARQIGKAYGAKEVFCQSRTGCEMHF